MQRARIHITGIVQGVGFRPFVYNLATSMGLGGECYNDSEGLVVEVEGAQIEKFIERVRSFPPPLARIEGFTVEVLSGPVGSKGFRIKESRPEAGKFVLVSPDITICPECTSELFDPRDRRYLYPFINCTNCGPRYSIVRDIPYDRPKTTMAPFPMCGDCEGEYTDPSDRRFHAQPNACGECGPKVWLAEKNSTEQSADGTNFTAIEQAQELLADGRILAIKGLGGFHLACDAMNDDAVKRLRARKRRSLKKASEGSNKPFAVMAPDMKAIKAFARVNTEEEGLLTGSIRPIVLLKKLARESLSRWVAPGNNRYGIMLPYTPLHYLLFHSGKREKRFTALVMTSGNLSEEPIVISNEEATRKLAGLADRFLLHNRDIYMRVDDSIARVERKRPRVLRRARGFVPNPVRLSEEVPEVLAFGGHLKNTFCITKGRNAILSQHIGDLENIESLEFFKETLANLKNTFRAEPETIAHDMHPDYLSTRFALEYAKERRIPEDRIFPVQHHHAHVVSCMVEHDLTGPVIGVAFDGTGYGTDGKVWGGEFLVATRTDFERTAHLDYVGLPGGDRAVREPWRCALSYLVYAFGTAGGGSGAVPEARGIVERIGSEKAGTVLAMIERGINTPLTSSAGRLFDAVSSLVGIRDEITFEGEAAIELESTADKYDPRSKNPYPFFITDSRPARVDTRPIVRAITGDLDSGVPATVISGRFHHTMAGIIHSVAKRIREATSINRVVLSGGVFQNKLLTDLTVTGLAEDGFTIWTHELVPANDGGISLGQAMVACERLKRF